MPGWELKIITAEAERLVALAAHDAELRADLRALASTILAATGSGTPDAEPAIPSESEATSPTSVPEPVEEPLRKLTLGQPQPSPEEDGLLRAKRGEPPSAEDECRSLEQRCRLKAAAARYATARVCQMGDDDAQRPPDAESARWAGQLTDCFYWASQQGSETPSGPSLLDQVAGAFEVVAESLALADESRGHRGPFERALHLVAEAQSALRRAFNQLGASADPDQCAVYEWLRAAAAHQRVYLSRFMRANDLADPAGWPDLLARIQALGATDPLARHHQDGLNLLRNAVDCLRDEPSSPEAGQDVARLVDELVREGLPPSHRGIRGLLLPVLEHLPHGENQPPGFQRVLRELDRFLAAQAPTRAVEPAEQPTNEVQQAAALLHGRSVVLIGGVRRPNAQRELKTALRMKELVWVETKEHQSIAAFEPFIERPDVAVVLLAIRWSSHAFGDVKQFCERHGKPLVRLPGGYGPNQVAVQILSQCSEQLRGG